MFRLTFYRPSASGELPKLHVLTSPDLAGISAACKGLRALGIPARVWGRDGSLFAL